MSVWYLHGANATSRSFAWLKRELPTHEAVNIDYSTDIPMAVVLDEIADRMASDPDITIVGHSLGGVLAVALSQRCSNVRQVVTMGAPFGGSNIASVMRWLSPHSFMNDIYPQSRLITGIHNKALTIPVFSIVTTGGRSPLIPEPNDGVVSVASQKALYGPHYVERGVNHFECLLDGETAQIISEFIQ